MKVGHHVEGQFWEVGEEKVALEGERFCGEGKFRLQLANDTGVAFQGLVDQTDTRGDNVRTGEGSVAGPKDFVGGGGGWTYNGHILRDDVITRIGRRQCGVFHRCKLAGCILSHATNE